MKLKEMRERLADLTPHRVVNYEDGTAIRIALHLLGVARAKVGAAGDGDNDARLLPQALDDLVPDAAPFKLRGVRGDTDDLDAATRERIRVLTQVIANNDVVVEALKAERTRAGARIAELERRVQELTLQRDANAGALESVARSRDEALNGRAEAERVVASLMTQLGEVNHAKAEAEFKLQNTDASLAEMTRLRDAEFLAHVAAQAQLQQAQDDALQFEQKLDEALGKLANTNLDLRNLQFNYKATVDNLQNLQRMLDVERETHAADAAEFTRQLQAMQSHVSQLNTDLISARSDYQGLLQVNNETLAELQSVRASAQATVGQLTATLSDQSAQVQDLSARLAQQTQIATTATSHLSNLLIIAGQGFPVSSTSTAAIARDWLSTNPLVPVDVPTIKESTQ